ncbi:MAG: hypothetical protein QOK12_3440 [Mycobacterium sp.]|nr:hypothetical protein [Mycobacterium sp.]
MPPKTREPDRVSALRDERLQVLRFCSELTGDDWLAPSSANGWRVKDVVAHLGAGCHGLFTADSLTLLRSKDIERTNDAMVDTRRDWEPRDVLVEYARWSARVTRLASVVAATPLNALRVPLAELGRFRLGLILGGAMVFDQHTHLRFDLAPALGRVAPPTDANRMSVVIEWMLAVLANQVQRARLEWMDRPVILTLRGLGGGSWSVTGEGAITTGRMEGPIGAAIFASAEQFPEWATRRAGWRERTVTVDGDIDYGERFLDSVNVV